MIKIEQLAMRHSKRIRVWADVAVMVIAGSLLLTMCTQAEARPTAGLEVGYVLDDTFRSNESPRYSYKLSMGVKDKPLYLFSQYETPKVRLLGQGLGETAKISYGVGVYKALGDLSVFLEAGWHVLDNDFEENQVIEMAYTTLVNNHHNKGRPIPFSKKDDGSRGQSITVDNAPGASIGLAYKLYPHVLITGTYTYLKPDMYIGMWDIERKEEGQGYWEERNTYDMSNFRIGIVLTY